MDHNNKLVLKLKDIIESGEYETESVDIDLTIFKEEGVSNISSELSDDSVINEMMQIFQNSKSYVSLVFYVNLCILFWFNVAFLFNIK